jgi:hypothetical protein
MTGLRILDLRRAGRWAAPPLSAVKVVMFWHAAFKRKFLLDNIRAN